MDFRRHDAGARLLCAPRAVPGFLGSTPCVCVRPESHSAEDAAHLGYDSDSSIDEDFIHGSGVMSRDEE
jgi:hypothetical protein